MNKESTITNMPLSLEYGAVSFHIELKYPSLALFIGMKGKLKAKDMAHTIDGSCIIAFPANCDIEFHSEDESGKCYIIAYDFSKLLPNMPPDDLILLPTIFNSSPIELDPESETETLFLIAWRSINEQTSIKKAEYVLMALFSSLPKDDADAVAMPNINPHQEALINKVKAIVIRDLSETFTLESIAEELFVNPSYLSNLFRVTTGITFCQFVNNCRIAEAKKLLTETDELVDDIAASIGFSTTSYFISVFRKQCGLTPNVFRHRIWKAKTIQKTTNILFN